MALDRRWIQNWKLPDSFLRYDNSKKMERLNTKWPPTPPHWLKLNFDGVARSGFATGGGIIRDSLGNLVLAYVGNFDSVSSNMAKALALFGGLKLALSTKARKLIIEGDSKVIIEATKGASGICWRIKNVIKDIWSMIVWLEDFKIQHIFREGNGVAKSLAETGLEIKGIRCWKHLGSLTDKQKDLIGTDQIASINNEVSTSFFQ
ncbi:uncharacterized protein LOC131857430 [Cryptomeria japonica]|uniref:uncharacterized protein LOC131857430 n=1 Tax=Cryptomeria japonica TaxID=3369 RepID=UPI0027DA1C4D|nr:uncharacterized protein LOC131857430 [Cryptomeria japonica]